MPRPISEMTPQQVANELANFQRFRISKDPDKRALFAKNIGRFEALLGANEARSGFRLDVSIGVIETSARNRKFLSYKDLADANGIEWNTAYRLIGGHLWDLVERSHARYGIMVSAIVVNKEHLADGNMEPETLRGFVTAAEELGYRVKDPEQFLRERQGEVFKFYTDR